MPTTNCLEEDRPLTASAPALELGDIQATVLRLRPAPHHGTYFMLRVDNAGAGRALLAAVLPWVASVANFGDAREAWSAVALSYPGLAALGLSEESLRSFPVAFREGMAARADHLCDRGVNDPRHWESPFGTGQIHIALAVCSGDRDAWRRAVDRVRDLVQSLRGLAPLLMDDFNGTSDGRNSLGYVDGIGQPPVEGSGIDPLPGQGRPIKAGEFILGHSGETGVPWPMPAPDVLGRNGTFVGLRKYQSRVGAFNRFLRTNGETDYERELLAAKLVGRWRSGAPLMLAPTRDDPALGADPRRNNDFTYAGDPSGKRVPLGCHMRRMNPRDTRTAVLTDPNLHRIIRRGSSFGPPYDPDAITDRDDEIPRGVYFMFLSARAMETIEFLQKEWINDGNFMNLGTEKDPVMGVHEEPGSFTIPGEPVRRRIHGLDTFNVLRGGEYLFMPSLSALRWLARYAE